MKFLIVVLFLISGYLFSLIYFKKKDLDDLVEELKYIDDKSLNISKLKSKTNDKDINELIVEINKVLDKKQELDISHKRSEKEVREMIASISHDLRTPLTSIKGYVDILDGKLDGKDEKKYIDIIKSRSSSLEELISNFYELSKLELKEYDYDLEYIDLEEILTEVVVSFYEELNKKDIKPNIDIEDGRYRVLGDRKAMERVFTNLIDNAIKYSHSFLSIELRTIDDSINLKFINDSTGLEEEDMEKIFGRFFVMDTSRQSESTGLGLYITKKMVEDMGYNIYGKMDKNNIIIEIDYKNKQ